MWFEYTIVVFIQVQVNIETICHRCFHDYHVSKNKLSVSFDNNLCKSPPSPPPRAPREIHCTTWDQVHVYTCVHFTIIQTYSFCLETC